MAKNKSIPGPQWYNAMDKLYAKKYESVVRKELNENGNLIELLGPYRENFISWCALSRVHYQANIQTEVEEFLELPWMKRAFFKGWIELKKKIIKRDGKVCYYCNESALKIEIDHKLPISRGGTNDENNLVVSCQKCNRTKRNKTEEEFLKWKELDL